MSLAIVISGLILAAGVTLLAYALRGRAIDNHPICRKCGFDLFTLDAATRCPECGTELSAKVIRLGHRAVRRWALGLGILFILPTLLILVAAAVLFIRKTDIETIKPVWLLIRDDDAPAVAELNRRLGLGTLTPAQTSQVIEAGLRAQAKRGPHDVWLTGWGDFIETARSTQMVSVDQWRRYAMGATTFVLEARAEVRRGDRIPIRVGAKPARVGSRGDLAVNHRFIRAAIDGNRLTGLLDENAGGGGVVLSFLFVGKGRWASPDVLECDAKTLATLSDGPHTLTADLRLDVRRWMSGQSLTGTVPDRVEWTVPLTTTITLVPENQPTIVLVGDDAKLTAAVRSIVPRGPRPGLGALSLPLSPEGLELNVDAVFPPIDLAFDVFLRDPTGREWPVHPITFRANEHGVYQLSARPDGFDSDRVDVILRSSPTAAASTVDLKRIWSGELVYVNRTVSWQTDMPRPARFDGGTTPRKAATTKAVP